MAGRNPQVKKAADGEAFPREKNGYAVEAVKEYIENLNRRFEDTLYDYKRQIVELKRELDVKSTGDAPNPDINKLLKQLDDAQNELEAANTRIEELAAERESLLEKVAQQSVEILRYRALAELDDMYERADSGHMYEIPTDDSAIPKFGMHIDASADIPGDIGSTTDADDISPETDTGSDESLLAIPVYEVSEHSNVTVIPDGGSEETDDTDSEFICWPSLDNACFVKPPSDEYDSEEADSNIYEIKPSAEPVSGFMAHPDGILTDAAKHSAEIIAEAREEAKRILQAADEDAERLRAERLMKTNEEARVIKREAYLRAKLMLERISRKLNTQIDSCYNALTDSGLNTYRGLTDLLVKLRVAVDDLNYTALDTAQQAMEEFRHDTSGEDRT